MRKHITIKIRETTRRGEFLPIEHGKKRQTRAKLYGIVSESMGDNLWVITWDNGQSTREKSTALCIKSSTAGRQPNYHCFLKAKHRKEAQGMIFMIMLITWPELPVLF